MDVTLQGHDSPATGGLIPPGMPGHTPGIGLPYDPGHARQLLAEAGYPKGHGFPVVDWLLSPGDKAMAEYLRLQWWENLGVEIKWETMEWATLLDKLDRDPPHAFILGWTADYPDPDNFLRASTIRPNNRWRNEAYHRLVEEVRQVMDQEERTKLYGRADRILVEEAAIIPLTYTREHILVEPWVSQYPMLAVGGAFWKDVIIEPH